MKWEEIEQYIQTHRDELDVETPDPALWDRIQGKLIIPKEKKPHKHFFSRYPYIKVAAIVLITVGVCYVIFKLEPWHQSYQLASSFHQLESTERPRTYHPELAEVETYYNMQVQQHMEEIQRYNLKNYHFAPEFLKELKQADASYLDLKKDIHQDGYNEKLINGLIATYELKIKILGELLHQIEQSKEQQIPTTNM